MITKELFEQVVSALCHSTDKYGNQLAMDSIIVSQDDVFFEHYFANQDKMNDLRSLSKPVLGLALGAAIGEGFMLRNRPLGLDTLIWPFFEQRINLTNRNNRAHLENMRLRHLLTHTMGYSTGLMFSKDVAGQEPERLLEYVFNTDIDYDPGTHFTYSNAGPFIISALIQEEIGLDLASWVSDLLLRHVGIIEYTWTKYGKYCAGSSGLRLKNADLHTLARLFVQDGRYKERQLIPESWITEMRSPNVLTPSMYDETRVFPKFAYGYGLWVCKDGRYYCDGTDGQYLIVLPHSRIVITTLGHQSDMKPITVCLRPFLDM